MCLWYPAYIITSRPFIGITWITWMRKFDFYFFLFKINLRNHTNPIVVIMFTQNIWSYTNILNIGADIHFVSEEIKFTFKSISTWDTFQLDGRVRCWNILVITSSSWYYFSYRMLMFQFTASCIDFICFNTKFTLGIAFYRIWTFVLLWGYGQMLFFCKLAFAVTLFTVPPISSPAICHDLWQKNLTHNLQRNHWHENECYKNVSGFYTDQHSHLNSWK